MGTAFSLFTKNFKAMAPDFITLLNKTGANVSANLRHMAKVALTAPKKNVWSEEEKKSRKGTKKERLKANKAVKRGKKKIGTGQRNDVSADEASSETVKKIKQSTRDGSKKERTGRRKVSPLEEKETDEEDAEDVAEFGKSKK